MRLQLRCHFLLTKRDVAYRSCERPSMGLILTDFTTSCAARTMGPKTGPFSRDHRPHHSSTVPFFAIQLRRSACHFSKVNCQNCPRNLRPWSDLGPHQRLVFSAKKRGGHNARPHFNERSFDTNGSQFSLGKFSQERFREISPHLDHVVLGVAGVTVATHAGEAKRIGPEAGIPGGMASLAMVGVLRIGDFGELPGDNEVARRGRSMDRMHAVGQRVGMVARLVMAGQAAVGAEEGPVSRR